jgi:hypothetical protein
MQCLQDKIGEGQGLEAEAIVSRDGLYVIDPTRSFSVASHWNVKTHLDIWILIMLFLLTLL